MGYLEPQGHNTTELVWLELLNSTHTDPVHIWILSTQLVAASRGGILLFAKKRHIGLQ